MTARAWARKVFAALGLLACGIAAAAEPLASPSATPVRHNSLKTCNQQADARNLSGNARAQFVKHCQTQTVGAHGTAPAVNASTPKPAGK
ncbi:MAG: hypothetical protein JSR36_10635 [Proteobacteria bacterium]|nr:hypothetical protein [Pseudomonadota bacterium]